MTRINIPFELTDRERDLLDGFAQLIIADLDKWQEALSINEERAIETGRPRQAERLKDACRHYGAVKTRIVQHRLQEILTDDLPKGER
ncbi:MAG: hypothetical protein K2I40_00645 [Bifidobacterium castoris]|nr:hypothetical protein [Bifidobacterium castoris]